MLFRSSVERYSGFSLGSFAITELRYSAKMLLCTSTKVSNLKLSSTPFTSDILSIYTYYTSQKSAIQICKPHYLSRLVHFLSGCSSACSGSVSITEVSFLFRFSSMLRAFSSFVFSFSSSSKAKGFLISSCAVSSCEIVYAFLVLADSSLAGSFDSSFSIRVRFPR